MTHNYPGRLSSAQLLAKQRLARLQRRFAFGESSQITIARSAIAPRDVRWPIVGVAGLVAAVAVAIVVATSAANGSDPSTDEVADGTAVANVQSPGEAIADLSFVGGKPLFPLPAGGVFNYQADLPVEVHGVTVQRLASDTGIWVGGDESQRIFVEVKPGVVDGSLTGLSVGEKINLSGHIRALYGDPRAVGAPMADVARLVDQSRYIEAVNVRAPSY